jgi:lysozyme family protein
MKENFEACLALVLAHEGGWSNHSQDPGGVTNLGVTQRAWEAWKGEPVTEEEMRNLTPEMVTPFYREMYWDKARCDDLPEGVDYCVFDAAVNSGVSRSAKWLQQGVGVLPDGQIGPKTLATVTAAAISDLEGLVEDIIEQRLLFLQSLVTWGTFGRGWGKRVVAVRRAALGMLKD